MVSFGVKGGRLGRVAGWVGKGSSSCRKLTYLMPKIACLTGSYYVIYAKMG